MEVKRILFRLSPDRRKTAGSQMDSGVNSEYASGWV